MSAPSQPKPYPGAPPHPNLEAKPISLVPPEVTGENRGEIKLRSRLVVDPNVNEIDPVVQKPTNLGLTRRATDSGAAGSKLVQDLTDPFGENPMAGDYLLGESGTKYLFPDDDHYRSTEGAARYAAYTQRLALVSRYIAYTSDIGESFRPVVPPWAVTAAYGISWAYVIGDVTYDGYQTMTRYKDVRGTDLAEHVLERATFQGLASMILPSIFIHQTVGLTQKICRSRAPRLHGWLPSAVGLACIPALPYMFDEPVEHAVAKIFHFIRPYDVKVVHQSTQVPEATTPVKIEETNRQAFDNDDSLKPAAAEL